MKNKVLFSETQRFNQWWLWVILVVINVVTAYQIYQQMMTDEGFVLDFTEGKVFIFAGILNIILIGLFLSICLQTKIAEDGIYFRFFPFHIKFKKYDWADISESFVRQYNPIMEYGGWGIRGIGKNKAFNLSGNRGLQLMFNDGSRRLLGTQKSDEIEQILKQITK